MDVKVYLLEEVAKMLRIPREDLTKAVASGEIQAVRIGGHLRITEAALLRALEPARQILVQEIDSTPSKPQAPVGPPTQPRAQAVYESGRHERDTYPAGVKRAKEWVWRELKSVATDLSPRSPSKEFTANGKQRILSVATKDNPTSAGRSWWFGFPRQLLEPGRSTLIVAVVAPRQGSEPKAFVIPYEKHQAAIDGWSVDYRGGKKYTIQEESGQVKKNPAKRDLASVTTCLAGA